MYGSERALDIIQVDTTPIHWRRDAEDTVPNPLQFSLSV
jgi:hypothetical protein